MPTTVGAPWSFLIAAWVFFVAVKRILQPVIGKAPVLRRKLQPMELAKELSKVYPAIVPVLHLGPQLMADKLPLWRRQTFPEDVWRRVKVDGKPMAQGMEVEQEDGAKVTKIVLDQEVARLLFRG